MLRIIGPSWSNELAKFLKKASKEIFIVVPYFSRNVVETIVSVIRPKVKIRALLGFEYRDVLSGGSDFTALVNLVQNAEVRHLRRVHAKVYIRDSEVAIVSSSNLTNSGLESNLEIGVRIDNEDLVTELSRLLHSYWEGAKPITKESLPSVREFKKLRLQYMEEQAKREYRQKREEGYLSDFRHMCEQAPFARNIIQENEMHSFIVDNKISTIRKCMPSKREIEARNELLRDLADVLTLGHINVITIDEFEDVLWGLQSRFGAIHRRNIDIILLNPIDRIRRSLMYLLWGDDDDLSRLTDILNEKAWQLKGVGLGVLSALLMVKNPERYPLYNMKVRRGLEKLVPGHSFGNKPRDYLLFSEKINKLRELYSIPATAIDWILWEISNK